MVTNIPNVLTILRAKPFRTKLADHQVVRIKNVYAQHLETRNVDLSTPLPPSLLERKHGWRNDVKVVACQPLNLRIPTGQLPQLSENR